MTKVFHFIEPPKPEDLAERVLTVSEMVDQIDAQSAKPEFGDAVVACFEAISTTYKRWMLPHLGDWTPDEIRTYGPQIDKLDSLTTDLGDALYKYNDRRAFVQIGRTIIEEMKELWQVMDDKGLAK